jgi:putative ABC transport system ATP-binding protein
MSSAPDAPGSARETGALVLADRLSRSFHNGTGETQVLRSASLELSRGGTHSLVGVSGSGKSTLLALVAGLMLPDSGRVMFDGEDIGSLDDVARALLRARRIGIVLQSGNLIPFLTAAENVALAVELAGGDGGTARARDVLSSLGLADRQDHLPRRLSGGEAQRVSVAMALVNEPDLLLADEVTGELDSGSADEVMELIFGASRERGLTVLYVTHSDELARRAQRRLRLAEGEVREA